jgi:ABC-type phosphate transport system substrate-binding protein
MSKKNDDARKKLDEVLAGLMTDKKKSESDKRLLATNNRSEEWHKNTAERNRKNATNETISNKIRNTNAGKRYTFLTKESIEKLARSGWQPIVTPTGIFACKKHADEYYFINNLTPCKVLGSVQGWVSRAMKQRKDEFYYITREEYIMLTGKDPWNEK